MPLDIEKLRAPFPQSAIKQREVGRKGSGRYCDYVEGHTVIHRLNEAAGEWDFRIIKIDRVGDGDNALLMATVSLDIPGLGHHEHVGVQKVYGDGGEDLVKGVVTDALKKVATMFGVGLELYGPDYAQGETDDRPQQQRPPQRQEQPRQQRPYSRNEGYQPRNYQQRPQQPPAQPAQQPPARSQGGKSEQEKYDTALQSCRQLCQKIYGESDEGYQKFVNWLGRAYSIERLADANYRDLCKIFRDLEELSKAIPEEKDAFAPGNMAQPTPEQQARFNEESRRPKR